MSQNNVRKVIFKRGDENRVVLEKDNFRESLFQEQYLDAMGSFIALCRTMDNNPENVSNIISFCGDRGAGKSSCMYTTREILKRNNVFSIDPSALNEHEARYLSFLKEIEQYPLYTMDVIDPSFFDDTHNILDLVISKLFQEAFGKEKEGERNPNAYSDRNELLRCFNSVKESMTLLETERKEILDNIEALDYLAEGLRLQKNVEKLFEDFLKYTGKRSNNSHTGKLIISIDDLDLNIDAGYEMLEQIRKYLSNQHCVILIALKIEQMVKVVQNALYKDNESRGEIISVEMCRDMAEKYITKMFPHEHRVQMPTVDEIVDYQLELRYDYETKDTLTNIKCDTWNSIKEAVVSLIFSKTRYLFYNKEHEVNLIIPRNLRSLRHLLAMLLKMSDFKKGSRESRENQMAFKKYFYNDWTNILPEDQKKLVKSIIDYSDVSTKNHYVLTTLLTQKLVGGEYTSFQWLISNAKAYNISVGDVLYVIQSLQETGHADLRELLFFLRSYYSICLYDYYDELVGEVPWAEKIPAVYEYQKYEAAGETGDNIRIKEQSTDKHIEIYAHDERFRGISKLQQFVGGTYYMYEPGDLLPIEQVELRNPLIENKIVYTGRIPRDYRNLNAGAIFSFMRSNVRENLLLEDVAVDRYQLDAFRLCEFFALTTKMSQTQEESEKGNYRNRAYPYYLSGFRSGNTILVFDILSIFSNVINLRFAYDRFNDAIWIKNSENKSFYDIALQQEGSLLNEMLKTQANNADAEKYIDPLRSAYIMGRFVSTCILRNVDAHDSLSAKIIASREALTKNKVSGAENIGRLIDLFKTIESSEIKLYGSADDAYDKLYTIQFNEMLGPIILFLEKIQRNDDSAFSYLFMSYEEHKVHERIKQGEANANDNMSLIPLSIGGVDTKYLSTIYDEICELDWTNGLNGKEIKNALHKTTHNSIPSKIRQCISSRRTYLSPEEFVDHIQYLVEQHLVIPSES